MKTVNKLQVDEASKESFVTKPIEKNSRLKSKKRTPLKYFKTHTEISSDATFLKNLRLRLDLNRPEAAKILNMSVSSIKRYETGVHELTIDKIDQFLNCYCISRTDYMSFKAGKNISLSKENIVLKEKVIENNSLRRSYKKIITNEVKALVHLRGIKGLTQYQLTEKCGWSRTTINHIESGRIELTEEKLKHILKSLEFTLKKFKQYLDSSFDRTSVEKKCIKKILSLDSTKLKSIETILENF